MREPYRIATPPEPEPPDPVDAYEAVFRARARRGRVLLIAAYLGLGAFWLGLASCQRSSAAAARHARVVLDPEAARRVATAREAAEDARRLAAIEQSRFSDAMLAALDAELEPERAESCDTGLPAAEGRAPFPLLVVAEGDRDLPSPSVAALLADVGRVERDLGAGRTREALGLARTLRAPERLRWDVVVVTSSMKHPERTGPSSFAPGEVDGRAYLYDFTARRVTCVGDVHAASSRSIGYAYSAGLTTPAAQDQGPSLTASLDADLDTQLRRAARGALLQAP